MTPVGVIAELLSRAAARVSPTAHRIASLGPCRRTAPQSRFGFPGNELGIATLAIPTRPLERTSGTPPTPPEVPKALWAPHPRICATTFWRCTAG